MTRERLEEDIKSLEALMKEKTESEVYNKLWQEGYKECLVDSANYMDLYYKKNSNLRKTAIKRKSSKQNDISKKYKKVISEIVQEREHYCTGCGTTNGLTNSHLISRQRRRDLVCCKENITFHCRDCHLIWEKDPIKRLEMDDYEENMKKIKKMDMVEYRKLKSYE